GMAIGILNAFYLRTISKAMNRVEMLEGLLPICSYCKKIRDDTGTAPGEGTWQQVEQYMHEKAATKFTHGVCPDCVEKAFPQKKP
ncbi:hypothetical protein H8E50_10055, partial [bacterium]|nr:hypothetical protein [bacterium]